MIKPNFQEILENLPKELKPEKAQDVVEPQSRREIEWGLRENEFVLYKTMCFCFSLNSQNINTMDGDCMNGMDLIMR